LLVFSMEEFIKNEIESLDYIKNWLLSIQIHANGAPIFMIGTFKDIVSNENDHKTIDEKLRDKFKFDEIAPSLVKNKEKKLIFWPIDNSKGPNGDDIIKLRNKILESVKNQKYLKKEIPLQFTSTYDQMIETKKDYIKMNEFNEIAKRNKLTNISDKMFMLKYFHDIGMLLHFDNEGNDELNEIIILNLQWLVNAITMVIREFDLHDYYDKELKNDLKGKYLKQFERLKTESIASIDLLNNRLWK